MPAKIAGLLSGRRLTRCKIKTSRLLRSSALNSLDEDHAKIAELAKSLPWLYDQSTDRKRLATQADIDELVSVRKAYVEILSSMRTIPRGYERYCDFVLLSVEGNNQRG